MKSLFHLCVACIFGVAAVGCGGGEATSTKTETKVTTPEGSTTTTTENKTETTPSGTTTTTTKKTETSGTNPPPPSNP